jgi:hypothetical protein
VGNCNRRLTGAVNLAAAEHDPVDPVPTVMRKNVSYTCTPDSNEAVGG